ncbi:MAG: flagellar biosynthesis protein FliQ [Oscillospiraceae bacterium]
MSISEVMSVFQYGVQTAIKVAAPMLIVGILVGLIISIFQAATQIHEQTLTFVPKLLAMVLVLVVLGPWMLENLIDFTTYIFETIAKLE